MKIPEGLKQWICPTLIATGYVGGVLIAGSSLVKYWQYDQEHNRPQLELNTVDLSVANTKITPERAWDYEIARRKQDYCPPGSREPFFEVTKKDGGPTEVTIFCLPKSVKP